MISLHFVTLCFSLLLQKNEKINEEAVRSIYEILFFYKEQAKNIPISVKQKFTLVYSAAKLKFDGKECDEIVDELFTNKAYNELHDFIKQSEQVVLDDYKIDISIKRINERKKLISIFKDLPLIENVINQFNGNSYENIHDFVDTYERLISNTHSRISEEKRSISITKISQLDLFKDDYQPVITQIQESYSGKNSISTGYSQLDEFLNGGFEPNRIYIFGGSSGDGKSTLLLNFVRNAVERRKTHEEKIGPSNIYIYITLENLIDESLVRLYCSITNKDIKEVVKNFSYEKRNIEKIIKEWQENNNSIVIMSYYPPTVTSVNDICTFINDVKSRYKTKGILKGVYVDYLDLLMSGQKFDLYRLEMGQVAIELKVAAVKENTPIVTLTQLNRSGYDHKEGLSLTQLSESIKKVEHADFVALLRSHILAEDNQIVTNTNEGMLTIHIGKNRSGPKNKVINLKTKFCNFRIDDNFINTSIPFEQNTHNITHEDDLSM